MGPALEPDKGTWCWSSPSRLGPGSFGATAAPPAAPALTWDMGAVRVAEVALWEGLPSVTHLHGCQAAGAAAPENDAFTACAACMVACTAVHKSDGSAGPQHRLRSERMKVRPAQQLEQEGACHT